MNDEEWKKVREEVALRNLNKISKLLPPLLGNLREFKKNFASRPEEVDMLETIERFLVEISERAVEGL